MAIMKNGQPWQPNQEQREKLGKVHKDKPKPTSECTKCHKQIANHLLNRWHNDNCTYGNN